MTKPLIDVDQLIRRTETASPMAVVLQKALALLNDPKSDADQLARVIQLDATLSGMVLRLANSAYFSPAQRISSARRAVAYLGQAQLKPLLFSAAAASYLDTPLPAYRLDRGALWSHALGMAAGARFLTASISVLAAEMAYTAGLLGDVGKLALDPLLPRDRPAAPTLQEEVDCLGIDHARLGAEIARRWRLPELIVEAIENHHTPGQARDAHKIAAALHLVDTCLVLHQPGPTQPAAPSSPDPDALRLFNLDEERFGRLHTAIQPLIRSAQATLGL